MKKVNKARARLAKRALALHKKKKKAFRCGVRHTNKLRIELEKAGLGLLDASGKTQCQTLLRVLIYRGSKGLNTLEGAACGFLRIATRIQELEEEGYDIESNRESAISADGLLHHGIARYVLLDAEPKLSPQGSLDLEEVQP